MTDLPDIIALAAIAIALFLLIPEISGLVKETKEMEGRG